MLNKKLRIWLIYPTLFLSIVVIILELYGFSHWHKLLPFTRTILLTFILWLLSFIAIVDKTRMAKLIFYIVGLIIVIGLFIFATLPIGIIAGIAVLGIVFSKLAVDKKRFVGKLFIDLGLIIAGISILVMGISYLKFQSVPDLVPFLWVIAAISFILGIIFTSITTPQRALLISLIATGCIGLFFVIAYGAAYLGDYFGGVTDNKALVGIMVSIIITIFVMGLELILYRYRQSKFAWLWLLTILIGLPATGFGPGIGIVIIIMGIALFPQWRDLYRYLFPKWIRIPYRDTSPGLDSRLRVNDYKKGFTLIELLIVIAIVAIISVGLISSFGFALWGIRHSELQTQAVFIAQSELDYLRALPYAQLKDETYTSFRGIKSNPMVEANGQIKIESTTEGLKKATIRIKWYEGTQLRQIELVTLIAKK
jgi:prepilin-type N-terminal cleavage/methylation domain-containing protein